MEKGYITSFLVIILIFTVVFISMNYRNNSTSQAQSVQQNGIPIKAEANIDLYTLYYSLEAKILTNTLTSEEKKSAIATMTNFDFEPFLQDYNTGNLYDIWLYSKILKNLNLSNPSRDSIINYINDLLSTNGYFLSYHGEDSKQEPENYLMSTKMALEILDILTYELSDQIYFSISNWLKENYSEFELDTNKYDIVSFSGFLNLISSIEITLKKHGIENLSIIKQINLHNLQKSLLDTKLDIQLMESIMDINQQLDKDIAPIDISDIKKITELENQDGGYPLYSQPKEKSDILTTYLVYKVLSQLNLEISLTNKQLKYLNTNLQYGLNKGIN